MVLTTCLVPSFRLADFGCNDHVTDDLAALEIVAMFVIICYYLSPATGDFFYRCFLKLQIADGGALLWLPWSAGTPYRPALEQPSSIRGG